MAWYNEMASNENENNGVWHQNNENMKEISKQWIENINGVISEMSIMAY